MAISTRYLLLFRFALDHAESSIELVEVITEALTLKETPFNTKLARFYLVSDILHNCTAAVPNASSFRSLYVYCCLIYFD